MVFNFATLELCDPGTYSASGRKPCLACGIGTYQPSYGRISCLPCGAEFRTKNTGSTGFQDCLARGFYDLYIHFIFRNQYALCKIFTSAFLDFSKLKFPLALQVRNVKY